MKYMIDFSSFPGMPYFTVFGHIRQAKRMGLEGVKFSTETEILYEKAITRAKSLLNVPDGMEVLILEPTQTLSALKIICKEIGIVGGSSLFFKNYPKLDYKKGPSTDFVEVSDFLSDQLTNKECVIVTKDDPVSGYTLNTNGTLKGQKTIGLDLSYSIPIYKIDYKSGTFIVIDVKACLGIPIDGFLLIYDAQTYDKEGMGKKITTLKKPMSLYLLERVLADMLEKGNEQMLREQSYKAAVLNYMFDNCSFLNPVVTENNQRSKNIFLAYPDVPADTISEKLKEFGIRIGTSALGGKEIISIANYPTHSKEVIELLSDRMVSLFV